MTSTDERLPIESARRLVAVQAHHVGLPDDHAVAVAACAAQIADELELERRERDAIALGALLHDLGKLSVDRQVLDKPGPLTARERAQIERHPEEGVRLLGDAVDGDVACVVRSHHERWDGTGYPDGLAATEIPLVARVVAVADAFLAMLEDRPYRRPLPREAALGELRANAGSQFDPRCVAALATVAAS